MTPTWYDLLGVEPTADPDEIRAAWRAAIADLDPTERRFATLNEAASVLLDPARRSAYDAELAPAVEVRGAPATSLETAEEGEPEPTSEVEPVETEPAPEATSEVSRLPSRLASSRLRTSAPLAPQPPSAKTPYLVPAWVLATLGVVTAAAVVLAIVLGTRPSAEKIVQTDVQLASGSTVSRIEEPALAAQAAAKEALVPLISYDYRHLDADKAKAESYLTDAYRKTYEKNFDGAVRSNALAGQFAITTKVISSAIVRVDVDRVQVMVLFDQSRTHKGSTTPDQFQDQVTMTMQHVDGRWLVGDLAINQSA